MPQLSGAPGGEFVRFCLDSGLWGRVAPTSSPRPPSLAGLRILAATAAGGEGCQRWGVAGDRGVALPRNTLRREESL
jgi:hypothetical protein